MNANDKVVCVNGSFTVACILMGVVKAFPEKEKVYVVRSAFWDRKGVHRLRLVGIDFTERNPCEPDKEWGFNANRFRKLDEMKEEARLRRVNEQPVGAPIATPVSQIDRAAITQP